MFQNGNMKAKLSQTFTGGKVQLLSLLTLAVKSGFVVPYPLNEDERFCGVPSVGTCYLVPTQKKGIEKVCFVSRLGGVVGLSRFTCEVDIENTNIPTASAYNNIVKAFGEIDFDVFLSKYYNLLLDKVKKMGKNSPLAEKGINLSIPTFSIVPPPPTGGSILDVLSSLLNSLPSFRVRLYVEPNYDLLFVISMIRLTSTFDRKKLVTNVFKCVFETGDVSCMLFYPYLLGLKDVV